MFAAHPALTIVLFQIYTNLKKKHLSYKIIL